MDNFITWEMLFTYTTLVTVVYMVVEFIKELPFVNKLQTKYLAWVASFIILLSSNLVVGSFELVNTMLYALTAISISLASNGLHDFNRKVLDEKENVK